MNQGRTSRIWTGLTALLLACALVVPVAAQDVFFTQSGGRGLQNAKTNARLSKAEGDIKLIQDDLKTIQPFARRQIPECASTGAKLLWRNDKWSCDEETDPTVQAFAKKELPKCSSGQILSASGGDFACTTSGFLSAESDPTVQPFAKQPLPSCGTGTVLSVGAGGDLKCVADNQGLTAETDPYVHDFARTDKATIANCDTDEVLKMTNSRLVCVDDQGIKVESDPTVQAFARKDTTGGTLTACSADQVVVAEMNGSNVVLACKDGATALAGTLAGQTLAGLADTNISSPANDEVLRYNGSNWVNSNDKIGAGTNTKWCYFSSGEIVCDRDVPAPMPASACTASEIVTWDGTAWGCQDIASAIGGALGLDDLNDVSITAPVNGEGLTYNGSGWVNGYDSRISRGDSDVRVVDAGTGAVQIVVDSVAVATATGNMLGINTNTPNAALDVIGLVSATNFQTSGYVNAVNIQASGYVSASTIHSSNTIIAGELQSTSDTRVGQDLYVAGNLYVSGSQQFDGVTFANGGISATGTISATNFAGDGSALTNVTAASTDKLVSGTTEVLASQNGSITIVTNGSIVGAIGANGNTGLGTQDPTAKLEVVGDISATNLRLSGNLYVSGTQSIDGVVFANGGVSATGTISATNFYGDGSGLSNVAAASVDWDNIISRPTSIDYVSTTLDTTELGYVNGLNQAVATSSAPSFAGLTLTGNVAATGRTFDLTSGGLISATTGNFQYISGTSAYLATASIPSLGAGNINATNITAVSLTTSGDTHVNNDLYVGGDFYVSGSQSIDGVVFANGGVSATGTISATNFYGDGSGLTGVTAASADWYTLTGIPAQVQEVSNSGAIVMAGISATNVSVTNNLMATNVAATTGTFTTATANTGSFGNVNATGYVSAATIQTSGTLLVSNTARADALASVGDTRVGNDLYVGGNLFVSGSQSIDGVIFANGGVSATGAVSATNFYGDGSGLTGVTAASTDRIVSGTTSIVGYNNNSLTFTTAGSQRMVIDENGNVGVGIATPTSKFMVVQGTTGMAFRVYNSTGSGAYIGSNTSNYFDANYNVFRSAGQVEIMRIVNGGYVGIGTAAPNASLNVSGTVAVSLSTQVANDPSLYVGTNGRVGVGTNSPGTKFQVDGGAIFANGTGTSLYVRDLASFRNGIANDSGPYLWLNGGTSGYTYISGSVGIGASTPLQMLHLRSASGGTQKIRFDDAVAPRNNYIGVDNYEQLVLAANEDNAGGAQPAIKFRVSGTEIARIANSGNVGIGFTSPNAKLDVNGDISATNLRLSGNLYVSGSQSIDGVIFANGGMTASGAVTADTLSATTVNGHYASFTTVTAGTYYGDGSGLTGVTAAGTDRVVSGTTSIVANNSSSISFSTAGVQRLVLDASGRMGLGVTPTSILLDVRGSRWTANSNQGIIGAYSTDAFAANVGAGLLLGGRYNASAETEYAQLTGVKENATSGNYAGNFVLGVRQNGVGPMYEAMRVLSSGYVGIGTASPQATVHVSGSMIVSTSAQAASNPSLYVGTNGYVGVGTSSPLTPLDVRGDVRADSGIYFVNGATNLMRITRVNTTNMGFFVDQNTERMRITNAGNVGIGTTNPSATLDVSGTVKVAGTGAETCDATRYGSIRLNPSTGAMEVCRQ